MWIIHVVIDLSARSFGSQPTEYPLSFPLLFSSSLGNHQIHKCKAIIPFLPAGNRGEIGFSFPFLVDLFSFAISTNSSNNPLPPLNPNQPN
jgi:hypothetical protein